MVALAKRQWVGIISELVLLAQLTMSAELVK
jgi:hypothetical protein